MKIEFERTLEDLIEFNLFSVDNSPSLRRQLLLQRVVISLLIFVTIPLVIYTTGNRHLEIFDYIISAIAGGFVLFIYPSIYRFDYIRRLKKLYSEGDNKAILGKHKYVVSQDGLTATTPAGESKINWSSINKIMENEKYIFLYIGAASAITVPRSSFSDSKSEKDFLDIVKTNTGR